MMNTMKIAKRIVSTKQNAILDQRRIAGFNALIQQIGETTMLTRKLKDGSSDEVKAFLSQVDADLVKAGLVAKKARNLSRR